MMTASWRPETRRMPASARIAALTLMPKSLTGVAFLLITSIIYVNTNIFNLPI